MFRRSFTLIQFPVGEGCSPMKRRGFTLTELLVVIAIVVTLTAIVLPAVLRVRDAAALTQTHDNLKQISLACHSANDAHKYMPPAYGQYGQRREFIATVHVHLLPYIEQDHLHELWIANPTGCARQCRPPLHCPSRPDAEQFPRRPELRRQPAPL
jgi:prepilin-type N-terminal cleavage/methylation domain-containing protein